MKMIRQPVTTPVILDFLVVVFILAAPINSSVSRTLDETPVTEDPTVKCGTCTQSPPPPPPPPSPCPPPPSLPPPSPPPPSPPPPSPPLPLPPPPEVYLPPPAPTIPSTGNCPPPPSTAGFIYAIGPPDSVYPIDTNYSNDVLRRVVVSFPIIVWCGFVVFLGFC